MSKRGARARRFRCLTCKVETHPENDGAPWFCPNCFEAFDYGQTRIAATVLSMAEEDDGTDSHLTVDLIKEYAESIIMKKKKPDS